MPNDEQHSREEFTGEAEEILDALWGSDYVVESNVVDRQVRNLRARLQDDWRRPRFIATVPGKGYRFGPTFRDEAPSS